MKLLKFNEPIQFGSSGNLRDYADGGWSLGEDSADFNWTEDIEARLQFNAMATSGGVNLHIAGFPFLADGRVAFQRVWVHLNGMYCGMFNVADRFEKVLPIRGAWLEQRSNVLAISLPNAVSPAQLGMGADRRLLGIGVQTVSLRSV